MTTWEVKDGADPQLNIALTEGELVQVLHGLEAIGNRDMRTQKDAKLNLKLQKKVRKWLKEAFFHSL